MTQKNRHDTFPPFRVARVEDARLRADDLGWEYVLRHPDHNGRYAGVRYFPEELLSMGYPLKSLTVMPMEMAESKDYDLKDRKDQGEPSFGLDHALQAYKINDDRIGMEDRPHIDADYRKAKREGTLDKREPAKVAGDDAENAGLGVC
jgi:hypothetical protein